jgi:hypothetical protein
MLLICSPPDATRAGAKKNALIFFLLSRHGGIESSGLALLVKDIALSSSALTMSSKISNPSPTSPFRPYRLALGNDHSV